MINISKRDCTIIINIIYQTFDLIPGYYYSSIHHTRYEEFIMFYLVKK